MEWNPDIKPHSVLRFKIWWVWDMRTGQEQKGVEVLRRILENEMDLVSEFDQSYTTSGYIYNLYNMHKI